jgi:hypothetical protein
MVNSGWKVSLEEEMGKEPPACIDSRRFVEEDLIPQIGKPKTVPREYRCPLSHPTDYHCQHPRPHLRPSIQFLTLRGEPIDLLLYASGRASLQPLVSSWLYSDSNE